LPSQREQILAAPAAQRSSLIAGYIGKTVNGLLGHDISRAVPGNIALSDFGVDSLQSIQLQARLEADLDVRLAVGSLPDQSIDVLAEEISGRMC
jgi:acyl carrier protein